MSDYPTGEFEAFAEFRFKATTRGQSASGLRMETGSMFS
jgi:hypothetical protein